MAQNSGLNFFCFYLLIYCLEPILQSFDDLFVILLELYYVRFTYLTSFGPSFSGIAGCFGTELYSSGSSLDFK